MLELVQQGAPDPMFTLKKIADADNDPRKVDLGVGVYRNEDGRYQELEVVRRAKKILDGLDLGHDYASTTGDEEFLRLGAAVLFGENCEALISGRVSSVQTISGTGANSLGASLIASTVPSTKVYIGLPTWGNHVPIFQHAGLEVVTYDYLDSTRHAVDFENLLDNVREAPLGSVFVLQGCCHNPTGVDLSPQQWGELAQELSTYNQVAFIDIAYQGLGDGLAEDATGLRTLADAGLEMLVCQSFSKNFALYGERCGALHVVSQKSWLAEIVKDQLRSIIRKTYSSSPAYGSRLVKIVLSDQSLRTLWTKELKAMRLRLKKNRQNLLSHIDAHHIPGDWSYLVSERGLFSCLQLTPAQCRTLVDHHHVHLPENGRINIAGLSEENIERAAKALKSVVCLGSKVRL